MSDALTARRLNRATLARQLLLRREPLDIVDAVHRVVALQAQEAASTYLALWNRIDGFDAAALDRAFAQHAIVKATLMRVTLHAVDAADYPTFHEAMQLTLRGARLNDGRFKSAGLSVEDAERILPEVLAFTSRPRTNPEVEAWFDERLGPLPKPSLWWAFRQQAAFVHSPTGGPWSFGPRPSYLAAPIQERSGDAEASMRTLARRYLEGFGPASVADFAQFGPIVRSLARAALESQADALERFDGPGGTILYDVPGGGRPDEDTPAPPRLLPMWDSVLLAYHDRSRLIPEAWRKVVIRMNGDSLPTILVDGEVAGVWRPTDDGIEATAFRKLSDDEWDGLEAEARALRAFLADREPLVYRRYGHWWSKGLPAAEVRVLGGDR
jgi:hypothetical protein